MPGSQSARAAARASARASVRASRASARASRRRITLGNSEALTPEENFAILLKSLLLPPELEAQITAIDTHYALQQLRLGIYANVSSGVIGFWHRMKERMLKVDLEELVLYWERQRGLKKFKIAQLRKIEAGENIGSWRRRNFPDPRLGVLLVVGKGRHRRRVFLRMHESHEWKIVVRALVYLWNKQITKTRRSSVAHANDLYRSQWAKAIRGENMTVSGLTALLRSLNIAADLRYVAMLFERSDEDDAKVVGYGEFIDILNWLVGFPEAEAYIGPYKTDGKLTAEGLKLFLRDVQVDSAAVVEGVVKHVLRKGEPYTSASSAVVSVNHPGAESSIALTQQGIHYVISGDTNSILDPDFSSYQIKLPMTGPLHTYWIKTCYNPCANKFHNTPNSSQAMVKTLFSGYRMIGVHVGRSTLNPNLPAIILRSKQPNSGPDSEMSIKEFVRIIKTHAFATSTQPLIVALDADHCGAAQLHVLALELKDGLRSTLYMHGGQEGPLPPPQDLAKRVVIASLFGRDGGRRVTGAEHDQWLRDALLLAADIAPENRDRKQCAITALCQPPHDSVLQILALSDDSAAMKEAEAEIAEITSICITHKPSSGLAFFDMKECTMIADYKINDLDPKETWDQFATQFVCVYPHPVHQQLFSEGSISSKAFVCGAQFVCADFSESVLGRAIFKENGRCGYVPKPSAPGPKMTLAVEVISGRQLPRGFAGDWVGRRGNRVVDQMRPYVVVSTVSDRVEKAVMYPKTNATAVNAGGFHPVFQKKAVFVVENPNLTALAFEVKHDDHCTTGQVIAQNSFLVRSIRQGLRWVPLEDTLGRPLPWAGLLVYVTYHSMMPSDPGGQDHGKLRHLTRLSGIIEVPSLPPPPFPRRF